MRLTRQRTKILEELRKQKTHPSAEEFFEEVKSKIPGINLASLYRNLEFLWRNKLVKKLHGGGDRMRFDADISHHPHMVCTSCRKIFDFECEKVNEAMKLLSNLMHEHSFHSFDLEFKGLCMDCMAKETETAEG